jgi:hypothetical protein
MLANYSMESVREHDLDLTIALLHDLIELLVK